MKADYNRDIFKQLEETLNRLDKMESTLDSVKTEHKIEIGQSFEVWKKRLTNTMTNDKL